MDSDGGLILTFLFVGAILGFTLASCNRTSDITIASGEEFSRCERLENALGRIDVDCEAFSHPSEAEDLIQRVWEVSREALKETK